MTNSGAFRAATQRVKKATGLALEDVLFDVFITSPRETASVIATQHMERGVI